MDSERERLGGLALCAGVGGLELGLSIAIPDYRTLCYVERDAYAAAALVARMDDEALDRAPIWSDVRSFDGGPWRERVAIVSAGFPCQATSQIGEQRGADDERWIWPEVVRVVREVGPELVFLENVAGLMARGMGEVLGDLAGLGFNAEWGVFSAARSGAPHLRRRVFILAADPRSQVADSSGDGLERLEPDGTAARTAGRGGRELRSVGSLSGVRELPMHDPPDPRARVRVSADRGMGFGPLRTEWWTAEPDVGRVAHGTPSRVDRLRCLGNAVVPAVAARAFRVLALRAGVESRWTREF